VADTPGVAALFAEHGFEWVVHLAAQAGVRYSVTNPNAYIQSNLVGFANILEGARHAGTKHLVYASSSSVYGTNTDMPFSVHQNTDHPVSLYAATKKANEAMAHAYSHLYKLPTTGLRFFTVYGPWGRPDMAPILFASAISEGRSIKVFNNGQMKRDFTFIDDIVEGVTRILWKPAEADPSYDTSRPDPAGSNVPYRVYNIGNNEPVELMRFISLLEENFGKTVEKEFLPMQQGDVVATFADVDALAEAVDFRPRTSIEEGVARFVAWYREYYS
jgi:UDP-glucuronate 4-epimerase